MLLLDTDAQLLPDGALEFSLPGWKRSRFRMEPWRRGLATYCTDRRGAHVSAAWPIVVLPEDRGEDCSEYRSEGRRDDARSDGRSLRDDVQRFVGEIPVEVRQVVRRYSFGQCLLLRSLAALSEAGDLAESNANLLWLLTLGAYEGRVAADDIGTLCRSRQVDVLRVLTGGGTKAQLKFLRKVRVAGGTLTEARVLDAAVRDGRIVHAVRHLPDVPTKLLSLLTRHARLADDAFVPLIAAKLGEAENAGPGPVSRLHRTLADLAAARTPPRLEDLRGALETIVAEPDPPRLMRETLRRLPPPAPPARPAVTFPPPPLAGTDTIVPITTVEELEEEGRSQRHCVPGYAGAIVAGSVYVYRVLAPQRATLEIRLAGGRPKLGQLKLAGNAKPSRATVKAVERWFASRTG